MRVRVGVVIAVGAMSLAGTAALVVILQLGVNDGIRVRVCHSCCPLKLAHTPYSLFQLPAVGVVLAGCNVESSSTIGMSAFGGES